MQQTHCGMHASIFFTYLDDQESRQSGLCPSRERSVPGRLLRTYLGLPITSSGFEAAAGVRGLTLEYVLQAAIMFFFSGRSQLLSKNITITEIVREKNIIAASKTCSNVNH